MGAFELLEYVSTSFLIKRMISTKPQNNYKFALDLSGLFVFSVLEDDCV